MIVALKLIVKRYQGYIGIALMMYDFTSCVTKPTEYEEAIYAQPE
ncbi:hypothetical protein [Flavobacterium frigidarium]|uniref:Uncharacterized protein n=1 Tax=Flavobacterium frigidarium TaxID=99286 RepID=A0ABV4KEG6_9FLAO